MASPLQDSVLVAELATEATCLWLSRSYDACLQTLQKLESAAGPDPCVTHNISIVEFYTEGCKGAGKLLAQLTEVKDSTKLQEEIDAVTPRSKVKTLGLDFSPTDSGALIIEPDQAIASINKAVILYHQHNYLAAVEILEPLFLIVEALEEGAALRVCFLLLDVYIECHVLHKAATVLSYLENSYDSIVECYQSRSTSVAQQTDSDRAPESPSVQQPSQAQASLNLSERGLPRVSKWRSTAVATAELVLKQQGNPLYKPDVKLLVRVYRVKLHVANRNYKAAKRELKCLLSTGPSNELGLVLRPQVELLRPNYKKAFKGVVSLIQEPCLGVLKPQLLNNLAVTCHFQGHHQTAALYLCKALTGLQTTFSTPNGNVQVQEANAGTVATPKHLAAMLYNLGIQHLMLKNYTTALNCFRQCRHLYYNQPLLWLRVGEACMGAVQQQVRPQGSTINPAVEDVLMEDGCCWILLPSGKRSLVSLSTSGGEADLLTAAEQAFGNALVLLDAAVQRHDATAHMVLQLTSFVTERGSTPGAGGNTTPGGEPSWDTPLGNGSNTPSPAPHTPSKKEASWADELGIVRQAILANLSYLHLTKEDAAPAYTVAVTLLGLPGSLLPQYSFLAHCYAAEALCLLNRPAEAAEHLSTLMVQNLEEAELDQTPIISMRALPADDDGSRDVWRLGNAADLESLTGIQARTALYINLASIYASQGELLQAYQCARQAVTIDHFNARALLILVYVELVRGNKDAALVLLRQQRFVS